ncbi:MAG: hydrogenase nickel incorporation protein HypB [Cyanobacteria bacterium P01_D01_bin.123]
MHEVFDTALGTNLLHANQHLAAHNRDRFDGADVVCLNLMSSPGSGKTALLEAALPLLTRELRVAIVEGDMTTQLDADRLRACGVPVIAINTGRACHLDAKMVSGGLLQLEQDIAALTEFDVVIVENVGNLVCPAEFEVGEHAKVALLSVTEGEDKPLKYPLMFQEADCLLITKTDLAPFLDIDCDRLASNVRQLNPDVDILELSAKTGVGIDAWVQWVRDRVATIRHTRKSEVVV